MVKTSTYSPKVRPMNSKTINRSSSSSHDKTTAATSNVSYSKSVDAKYYPRAFDYTHSKLSPRRDNSAVLRAVSASASSNTSCFATASRLNKHRYQKPTYESHEMFEQQTQQQPDVQQNIFGKYDKEPPFNNDIVAHNGATTADDGDNQMVVITLNGASAQQKQVNTMYQTKQREGKRQRR